MKKTVIRFTGQESRLLDLSLKDFCKMLNKKDVVYKGPLLQHKKSIDGEVFHRRKIIFNSEISFVIIQGFDFPPSVEVNVDA